MKGEDVGCDGRNVSGELWIIFDAIVDWCSWLLRS